MLYGLHFMHGLFPKDQVQPRFFCIVVLLSSSFTCLATQNVPATFDTLKHFRDSKTQVLDSSSNDCKTPLLQRYSNSKLGSRLLHSGCSARSSTLHLRGGKLHPALYPWLLAGHCAVRVHPFLALHMECHGVVYRYHSLTGVHYQADYYSTLDVSADATTEEVCLSIDPV